VYALLCELMVYCLVCVFVLCVVYVSIPVFADLRALFTGRYDSPELPPSAAEMGLLLVFADLRDLVYW